MVKDEIEIPVQINGVLRYKISVSSTASQEEIEKVALSDEKLKNYTEGKTIAKVIVVKTKIINIVVK